MTLSFVRDKGAFSGTWPARIWDAPVVDHFRPCGHEIHRDKAVLFI